MVENFFNNRTKKEYNKKQKGSQANNCYTSQYRQKENNMRANTSTVLCKSLEPPLISLYFDRKWEAGVEMFKHMYKFT